MPQAVLDALEIQASGAVGTTDSVASSGGAAETGTADEGQLSSINSEEIASDEGELEIHMVSVGSLIPMQLFLNFYM